MTPWTDRAGRFSPLKAFTLAGLLLPALLLGWHAATGGLGPRPYNQAIHVTGDWAIRFLVLSLAVTPLRRILDWPKLILVRRMVGLSALFYALGHLALYVVDLNGALGRVITEIFSRVYLTIGFAALVGLVALGITSTDAALRWMGRWWIRLHRLAYGIGVLAAIHFFMQTKADVFEATILAGLFLILMVYRLAHALRLSLTSPAVLAGAALVAAVLTAAAEYAWYGLATGIPPLRVLQANLHVELQVRPALWIGIAGLAVAAVAAGLPQLRPRAPARGRQQARRSAA